jgi:hypothetical protein
MIRDDWNRPRRPLTLEELEALHAPDAWNGAIPGLPDPRRRTALLLVALVFGGIGFGIAAIHHASSAPPAPRAQAHQIVLEARRSPEPLPSLPALGGARALPELERPTRTAAARSAADPLPEPSVVSRGPEPQASTPAGFIAAEVDAETARAYERKRAFERERATVFDSE